MLGENDGANLEHHRRLTGLGFETLKFIERVMIGDVHGDLLVAEHHRSKQKTAQPEHAPNPRDYSNWNAYNNTNQEIIELLKELRDAQKAHTELYRSHIESVDQKLDQDQALHNAKAQSFNEQNQAEMRRHNVKIEKSFILGIVMFVAVLGMCLGTMIIVQIESVMNYIDATIN